MHIVGVEMVVGTVVLPDYLRLGSYLAAGWLFCIALKLVAGARHRDVAIRDVVMTVVAVRWARLGQLVRTAARPFDSTLRPPLSDRLHGGGTRMKRMLAAQGSIGLTLIATAAATLALTGPVAGERPAHEARNGQEIFRFDTFGDEQLWTNVLRMHEVVAGVDPKTALAVGLKVDVDALPRATVKALRSGQLDLTDPAVTIALLQLNAVVGIQGTIDGSGQLTSLGITCALCHSTVDDSFAKGIGRRLDGWANRDLNVGAIVSLSPAISDELKAELGTWGPGRYDPRHHAFDGTNLLPLNSPSIPIEIPSIYGLEHVGFETYTADGPISYWNSYVGVGQMGGHGGFSDARLGLFITQTPDLVTPKLAALLDYQLRLRAPDPPPGSFDKRAAQRGRDVFRGQGGCANCHQGSTLTDVLSGRDGITPFLHDPSEVGMDPSYAARSATGKYRTTPLRGLWQHAPYFHDGSAADLPAVVNHYDSLFDLGLSRRQKADLVEYLKSL
jgi:mono/diheme cytochrome c family protein